MMSGEQLVLHAGALTAARFALRSLDGANDSLGEGRTSEAIMRIADSREELVRVIDKLTDMQSRAPIVEGDV